MDDCTLEKLAIKPGKLNPVFHKDTTEYNVTAASNVENVTLDCMASDNGASYCISGGDGGRTVPLKEGQMNDIKIEVTAEDGTIKNYFVHVRRLSAKDATLSNLKTSSGTLHPAFTANTYEYSCLLPCNITNLTVTPEVPDSKAEVLINGEKAGKPFSLNTGLTKLAIDVKSPDGSNSQVYLLSVYKKQIPRHIKFTDASLAMKYECPVSLSALYQPISVKDSNPKHSFTGPIIDEFTKTCKLDPLNEMPLSTDWRHEDFELDSEMSQAVACIPLANGGTTDPVKLGELGVKLKDCCQTPKFALADIKKFDGTSCPLKHTNEVRGWEKQLQQIFDESDATQLAIMAEQWLEKYFSSIPKPNSYTKFEPGQSPAELLNQAIYCYSTALKSKKSNANLHNKLGLALEEKYYMEDLLGLKKESDSGADFPSMNVQAKESSKKDECEAICLLRGVGASAPLPLQLKAIDAEYHHLVESGQSGKADHVMQLFVWKSKQATQEGAASQKASDDQSPLGQAYLKYLDALSLDETKAVFHFHVGRVQCIKGEYDEAVKRLEATLGWNEKLQMAKFYLGLALCLRKGGPGERAQEAMSYLLEAMESLLQQNSTEAQTCQPLSNKLTTLHAENLLRNTNVHLLRGFIQLGKLLRKNPQADCISAEDVFHTAALIASQALIMVSKGDAYMQFEWVLLEAHSQLLEILLETQKDNVPLLAQRCERLSAMIKKTTIPQNAAIFEVQEKTNQMLVQIKPCSSHALFLLGNTQLTAYDNDPEGGSAAVYLESAKLSFEAAISMEGKPASGDLPPDLISQKWWQDKQKEDEDKKKAADAAKAAEAKAQAPKGGAAPTRGGAARGVARGGAVAGRGAPAGRAAPAARGAAATPARGGAAAKTPARGGANAGRGGSTAGRGGAKAAPMPVKAAAVKAGSKPAPSGSKHSCEEITTVSAKPGAAKPGSAKAGSSRPGSGRPGSAAKRPSSAAKKTEEGGKSAISAPVNEKSYKPRLGLARALSKETDDLTESKKYYNEVIDLAPDLHDAYVESAELLTKTDPLGAADIYCRFPVSDNPTFDDAYIFGEIVRLLIKNEKYDDPRLEKNMISMGKVMGLGSLEKYVKILDDKFKTKTLKAVYAGVNGKEVDDPDMQAFFKLKCWT